MNRLAKLLLPVALLSSPTYLSCAFALEEEPELAVAEGDGIHISMSELESRAAKDLGNLSIERLRFEAQQKKKRHEILRKQLESMVADQLLEIEARAKSLSRDELLNEEVHSKASEPSDEEVEAFYEGNKKRIRGEKEQVLPRIKEYLKKQQSDKSYESFLTALREKYSVVYSLAPLRFEVGTAGSPSLGPEDAPVTVVEFSDFQCPYCARVGASLKQLVNEYADQVRVVFRQYPLQNIHPQAQKAAEASLCAGEQGMFWPMHDALFADQKKLSVEDLKKTAETLGMEPQAFAACLDSNRHAETVARDIYEGTKAGVSGTPAFLVNGRLLSGAVPYERVSALVKEELKLLEEVNSASQ
jgi:predicted DsbA family dithiol-disulfide isomerase